MPRTTAGYKTDLRQTERQTDRRLLAVICHNRSSSIFFCWDYLWSCLIFIIIASYSFSMLVPTTFQPTSDKALALFRSLYEYILENGRERSSPPLSTWYCQYGHLERLFNHCLNGNLCLLIISTAILTPHSSSLPSPLPRMKRLINALANSPHLIHLLLLLLYLPLLLRVFGLRLWISQY